MLYSAIDEDTFIIISVSVSSVSPLFFAFLLTFSFSFLLFGAFFFLLFPKNEKPVFISPRSCADGSFSVR